MKNLTKKQKIIEKVNEKYELELKAEEEQIETIPNTKGRDLINPYIWPFAIATGIALVYMAIRYRKLNIINVIVKTVLTLVVAEATLISLIAITRIPIGRLTIPMVGTVYMLTFVGLTTKFEKELEAQKEE